jgi:hypothetical protein
LLCTAGILVYIRTRVYATTHALLTYIDDYACMYRADGHTRIINRIQRTYVYAQLFPSLCCGGTDNQSGRRYRTQNGSTRSGPPIVYILYGLTKYQATYANDKLIITPHGIVLFVRACIYILLSACKLCSQRLQRVTVVTLSLHANPVASSSVTAASERGRQQH